jgi:hypothetical protein
MASLGEALWWTWERFAGEGQSAYTALLSGGTSGFNAVLGANRSIDGQYDRLEAHETYWTVSENDPITAPHYNFGKGSQALYLGSRARSRGSFRPVRPAVTAGPASLHQSSHTPDPVRKRAGPQATHEAFERQ